MSASEAADFFEVHLTVDEGGADGGLAAAADRLGLRLTHIVLAKGRSPSQRLCTARFSLRGAAPWRRALERAAHLADRLRAAGARLSRVKVERDLDRGAPTGSWAPGAAPLYREHHVKVLTPPGRLGALSALSAALGAHLSKNAFQPAAAGEQRFLTQRFAAAEADRAEAALAALRGRLQEGAFTVLDIERELVIHDSNLELDDGWME